MAEDANTEEKPVEKTQRETELENAIRQYQAKDYVESLADDKTFRLELLLRLDKINENFQVLNSIILDAIQQANPAAEEVKIEEKSEEKIQ